MVESKTSSLRYTEVDTGYSENSKYLNIAVPFHL